MTRFMTIKLLNVAALLASCTILTACGGEAEKEEKPAPRGIVTSALECADLFQLKVADCQKALRSAIGKHERSSTTYTREHKCEEAEGAQRCERAGQNAFSRRLQAFLLAIKEPLEAAPLYATTDGKAGFKTGSGNVIPYDDEKVTFSDQALAIAEQNGELDAKRGGGGF